MHANKQVNKHTATSSKSLELNTQAQAFSKSSRNRFRYKNIFFLKTYLEVVTGPSVRVKSALQRVLKANVSKKNLQLRLILPRHLRKGSVRSALQEIFTSCYASSSSRLIKSSLRVKLMEKVAKAKARRITTLLEIDTSLLVTQPRKLNVKPNPVLFSKQYVLPYLRVKYETYAAILNPNDILVQEQLQHRVPLLYSPFTEMSSVVGAFWFTCWQKLIKVYLSFNTVPHAELYLRARKASHLEVRHLLQFKFKGSKLSINLLDLEYQLTHIGLTPGLFLKYFQNKKSLKKNKSMKLLMARFLRKLLLILRLKNIVIISRGVPVHFNLLLSTLFKPLSHPFLDPISMKLIDETQDEKSLLRISELSFPSSKPFGTQKMKKKGRVKRKIRRKLTRLNSVID